MAKIMVESLRFTLDKDYIIISGHTLKPSWLKVKGDYEKFGQNELNSQV